MKTIYFSATKRHNKTQKKKSENTRYQPRGVTGIHGGREDTGNMTEGIFLQGGFRPPQRDLA
jgi:hypothetical protein